MWEKSLHNKVKFLEKNGPLILKPAHQLNAERLEAIRAEKISSQSHHDITRMEPFEYNVAIDWDKSRVPQVVKNEAHVINLANEYYSLSLLDCTVRQMSNFKEPIEHVRGQWPYAIFVIRGLVLKNSGFMVLQNSICRTCFALASTIDHSNRSNFFPRWKDFLARFRYFNQKILSRFSLFLEWVIFRWRWANFSFLFSRPERVFTYSTNWSCVRFLLPGSTNFGVDANQCASNKKISEKSVWFVINVVQ